MATIDITQDAASPALVGGAGTPILYKKFVFSKGSAPITGDIFQIWDIPARTRVVHVKAQAADLADGAWSVGDQVDANRFVDVADASAVINVPTASSSLGHLYTAADTLDVTMGSLTTATDVTFTVEVWYVMDYSSATS